MYLPVHDPMFIVVLVVLGLSILAQVGVKGAFDKWSKVASRKGVTAAEVARSILNSSGLGDMKINQTAGNLTDHYNPVNRTLNLSESVYSSTSVAALGIAAHEAGHAIQHRTSFAPLVLRNGIYPLAQFGTSLSYILFIAGILLSSLHFLTTIAIYLFAFFTLFTIITLPVEFDASNRAKRILVQEGHLSAQEMTGVNAVLNAAAMTYVAAAAMAIVQLLRMILISRSR
jgi:Zn-dependent membrane protease YugP